MKYIYPTAIHGDIKALKLYFICSSYSDIIFKGWGREEDRKRDCMMERRIGQSPYFAPTLFNCSKL
jgi:hypothetical protein